MREASAPGQLVRIRNQEYARDAAAFVELKRADVSQLAASVEQHPGLAVYIGEFRLESRCDALLHQAGKEAGNAIRSKDRIHCGRRFAAAVRVQHDVLP